MRSYGLKPAAIALLAFVLIWMGGGCSLLRPSATPTASTGTEVVQTPVAEDTSRLASRQVLNLVGGISEGASLDPALVRDAQSFFLVRQIFGGLVTLDDDLNVVPDIAAQMPDISADGRTYTFHLRSGVNFQDGKEVKAQDFKYSLERATDPSLAGQGGSLPAAAYLSDIVGVSDKLQGKAKAVAGVVAKDDHTLEITIDAPKAYFLSKLTFSTSFVVDKANVEKGGANWIQHPNGTGPFKLKEWKAGDHITLVSNAKYHLGTPKLQTVNLWLGVKATGTMTQYENGQMDVIDVPLSDLDRVMDKANPLSRELTVTPSLSLTYVGLNTKLKPFDDPKIRQAFSYALDTKKIASAMFEHKVQQARSIVPPDMPNYTGSVTEPEYHLDKARQLIADSSYKSPESIPRVTVYTAGSGMSDLLLEVLTKDLGIKAEVRELDWNAYLAGLSRREYQAYVLSWVADYPDPQNFLEILFHTSSSENYGGYSNRQVDSLLDKAAVEQDRDTRMKDYSQAEQDIMSDVPVIPLYFDTNYVLTKPYVKGVCSTPLGILNLKDGWIQKH